MFFVHAAQKTLVLVEEVHLFLTTVRVDSLDGVHQSVQVAEWK